MQFEVSQITQEQLNKILQIKEGHFLDLKSIDIKPAKLSRSISAFANASAGDIYIGIDEDDNRQGNKIRNWRGFDDPEATNAHLQLLHEIFPDRNGYDCIFLESQEVSGLVLQFTIHKSREIVYASDGKPYIRQGAQNLPVNDPQGLDRLRLYKGINSYETQTIDVESDVIVESETIKKFITSVIPNSMPETWVKKQQLLKYGKPTIAGVLLFSDEPQAIIPKRCGIKIYRYKTKELEGTRETLAFDPITIEGCLYVQIQNSVSKIIEVVQEVSKMGKEGLESIKYPQDAIHEIVTNAVLHRDYSIVSDVQVRIFDNRIEIESPGKLPGHITVENILKEQFARNGAIVRIINKFPDPPNKDVGEGLNTAFQAMAKLRLKPPEICERENSVIVSIKHEPLASPETTIMDYLNDHQEITNKKARQITGITSEGTIKGVFYRLHRTGLIELIPGRPKCKASWCKTGTFKNQDENTKPMEDLYPEYEKKILEYLADNEEINNRQAREIIGIDASKAKNVFNRLRKKSLLEIVPGKPRNKSTWRRLK